MLSLAESWRTGSRSSGQKDRESAVWSGSGLEGRRQDDEKGRALN